MNVTDVEQAIEAGASGSVVAEILDGEKRYTVALRLPERYRSDPDAFRNILLHAPNGEQVSLGQVAHVEVTRTAERIDREQGQRRVVVISNVRGRDLGSFVAEVQSKIEGDVKLPTGYSITYGGQFENQQRATRRLLLIVPIVITAIFVLLYLTFGSLKQAVLVVGNVPFALVGGVAALWIRGMNLNLSASIGFIALFGVAMLNGVVLVSSINQLRQAGETTRSAVLAGARRRLRPVLMTALVASFGFIPMAVSTSNRIRFFALILLVVNRSRSDGLLASDRATLIRRKLWPFNKVTIDGNNACPVGTVIVPDHRWFDMRQDAIRFSDCVRYLRSKMSAFYFVAHFASRSFD